MGEVFAAHDERLDRSVALKVIREHGEDDQARKRFWREARAAAGLNHPNVCQLHEIGEEEGVLFIVMELLEGEIAGGADRPGSPARFPKLPGSASASWPPSRRCTAARSSIATSSRPMCSSPPTA